jgi:hypothetical protein
MMLEMSRPLWWWMLSLWRSFLLAMVYDNEVQSEAFVQRRINLSRRMIRCGSKEGWLRSRNIISRNAGLKNVRLERGDTSGGRRESSCREDWI